MPEGDTVWHAAHRLHRAFAGETLTHADLRVPRHATVDLTGRLVRDVTSRGKHLLIRLEPNLTLHTHLGMDGVWRVHQSRGRVPRRDDVRVRVVLVTGAWLAVGADLASVDVVPTGEEGQLVDHLGPDLLGTDWDPAEAVRRLRTRPDRELGEALLDQGNLAGIGNVYRAELLFLRGLPPDATVADVGDLDRLVRLAHQLLSANRTFPAHVTTGKRRPDERHWVYGRAGEPCRRCGTPIAKQLGDATTARRVTYWCPTCQPPRR